MHVLIAFMKEKDAKKSLKDDKQPVLKRSTTSVLQQWKQDTEDIEEGLPEAVKIRDLLWDPVQEVSTKRFGIDFDDERTMAVRKLLKRVLSNELKKVVHM